MRVGRWMTVGFMVAGLNVCPAGSAAAQTGAPAGPGPIAQSVERVVAVVSLADAEKSADKEDTLVFRSGVTRDVPLSSLPWIDPNPPFQPRPPGGTETHYQYLMATTPEAFRASAVYAAGSGARVDPGELINGVKASWRGWQARRARERIERELAELRGETVPR